MTSSESDSRTKPDSNKVAFRPERIPLDTEIEFIADFDLLKAEGINISEGGIAFEIKGGLPFEMRFKFEGQDQTYQAELVWMKRLPHGGYRMGLKFVGRGPETEF